MSPAICSARTAGANTRHRRSASHSGSWDGSMATPPSALSFAYADNWLTGNGLQDFRFLEQDYRSVYSIPDITWNRSPSFNLSVRHNVTSNLTLLRERIFPLHPRRHHQRRHQLAVVRRIALTISARRTSRADRRRLQRLPDHRQRHHRAVSLLALHRAGARTGRADRDVYRHHHQHLHQAAQLRALRTGVLAGRAQPRHGGLRLGTAAA